VATSLSTLQTRLELAETEYDRMIVEGRSIVEYREQSTGLSVRKDPEGMVKYLEYLRGRISALGSGSGGRGTTTFASMRRAQ
jgi:hypothetical protein